MRIALFEDQKSDQLTPVALMRPVFELVCGRYSLRDRLQRQFGVTEWGAFVRKFLVEAYREEQEGVPVNEELWLSQGPTLLINGRWLPTLEELQAIQPETVGLKGETICYLTLDPLEAALLSCDRWDEELTRIARDRRPVEVTSEVISYPWKLVDLNSTQLQRDFAFHAKDQHPLPEGLTVVGPRENLQVHPTATIEPFVTFDVRGGGISIAAGAHIQSFTRVEGPCHIGEDSQLFQAAIRKGTTIGPVCRVGGEVENSILHGFVNKYHEGFLGHSYICPWVNLGAGTHNSDLRTDYAPVRVPVGNELVNSGLMKVGCFIGDHTKTALASLFNTGSSVGVMAVILPGGELLPRHIPSFCRIWHGELTDGGEVDVCLKTARAAMARRGRELTPATEKLVRYLAKYTQIERGNAIRKDQEKIVRRQADLNSHTIHWK